jgi:amino acid transporter
MSTSIAVNYGRSVCFWNRWDGDFPSAFSEIRRLLCRYAPFGVNGVFGGAAMVFFAYIGFDAVAATAEEVRFVAPSIFIFACL